MSIMDAFSVTSISAALGVAEYDFLIDIVSDNHFQASFKSKPISDL